jgi:hypothetical protein
MFVCREIQCKSDTKQTTPNYSKCSFGYTHPPPLKLGYMLFQLSGENQTSCIDHSIYIPCCVSELYMCTWRYIYPKKRVCFCGMAMAHLCHKTFMHSFTWAWICPCLIGLATNAISWWWSRPTAIHPLPCCKPSCARNVSNFWAIKIAKIGFPLEANNKQRWAAGNFRDSRTSLLSTFNPTLA